MLRWSQPGAEGCQGSRRGRSSTEQRRDSASFGGARGSIGSWGQAAAGLRGSQPAAEGGQGSRRGRSSTERRRDSENFGGARGSIGSGGRQRPCCNGRSPPPRGARGPDEADRQRNGVATQPARRAQDLDGTARRGGSATAGGSIGSRGSRRPPRGATDTDVCPRRSPARAPRAGLRHISAAPGVALGAGAGSGPMVALSGGSRKLSVAARVASGAGAGSGHDERGQPAAEGG